MFSFIYENTIALILPTAVFVNSQWNIHENESDPTDHVIFL